MIGLLLWFVITRTIWRRQSVRFRDLAFFFVLFNFKTESSILIHFVRLCVAAGLSAFVMKFPERVNNGFLLDLSGFSDCWKILSFHIWSFGIGGVNSWSFRVEFIFGRCKTVNPINTFFRCFESRCKALNTSRRIKLIIWTSQYIGWSQFSELFRVLCHGYPHYMLIKLQIIFRVFSWNNLNRCFWLNWPSPWRTKFCFDQIVYEAINFIGISIPFTFEMVYFVIKHFNKATSFYVTNLTAAMRPFWILSCYLVIDEHIDGISP